MVRGISYWVISFECEYYHYVFAFRLSCVRVL